MAAVSEQAKSNRRQYRRDWYVRNKDRLALISKERYANNRESILLKQAESGRQRPNRYKRLYGITPEDYERMLAEQGGGCAICKTRVVDVHGRRKYFCVDHCHENGKARGLLCVKCNIFLGHFEKRRDAVLSYLDSHE